MKTVAALQTGAAISGAIGAGKLAAAGATVAGKAVKATAGKVEKLIERSAAEEALGDAGSGARDKVAEEIDALKRIKENANGPDLTDRSKNAIAYQQSDRMLSDLASQYNDTSVHPRDFKVNIGDKVFSADPNVSIGAPVYMGVTTDEVMLYFRQLAGAADMPVARNIPGKGVLYNIKIMDGPNAGSSFTLREYSSSGQATGAKWTIDVINGRINKGRPVEIKFK